MGHDADDCKALFEAGKITLYPGLRARLRQAGAPYDTAGVDFGDDTSATATTANATIRGSLGRASPTVLDDDTLHDATDCKAASRPAPRPEDGAARGAPDATECRSEIRPSTFGDNASEYANDNECDDPRFIGEGWTRCCWHADIEHDATDCRALVDAGKIIAFMPVFGADYVNGAPYDSRRSTSATTLRASQERRVRRPALCRAGHGLVRARCRHAARCGRLQGGVRCRPVCEAWRLPPGRGIPAFSPGRAGPAIHRAGLSFGPRLAPVTGRAARCGSRRRRTSARLRAPLR